MADAQLIRDKTELAILYFKSEDYVKALGVYNQLIHLISTIPAKQLKSIRKSQYGLSETPIMGPVIHPKLSSLLDQRAATYERLGQVANALLDAKKLMEVDPVGCKGYLRRGKLLYAMSKPIEAYRCYQTGMYIIDKAKKEFGIKVSENLYGNLKSQYGKLNSELKMKRKLEGKKQEAVVVKKVKKLMDPFCHLPLELIEKVFINLEVKEILQCHLVCKTWYFKLIAIPALYNWRVNFRSNVTLNEFNFAYRLLKKINLKRFSIKFNSIHSGSLSKITEAMLVQSISIEKLELVDRNITMSLLFEQLIKLSWKVRNFQNLKSFKITINEDTSYGARVLLNQFKNLEDLQVIVVHPSQTKYPIRDKIFQKLKQQTLEQYKLESLTLVNHPTKISTIRMLDLKYPNLSELTIVCHEFNDKLSEFGEFLVRSNNLSKIHFENNSNLSLFTFLILLKNFNPSFSLKELTFREGGNQHSMITLNEINEISQLQDVIKLDLYNHNLSLHGLIKLLRMCGEKVTSLNIGNGKYISFSKYSPQLIKVSGILKHCPNLYQLYVNEMNIDNDSIIQITNDLKGVTHHKLNYVDVSFNEKIDGINLIKLCQGFRFVNCLVIHGLEILKETLNYIVRQHIVERFVIDVMRNRWRVFGVNSWIQ